MTWFFLKTLAQNLRIAWIIAATKTRHERNDRASRRDLVRCLARQRNVLVRG